MSQPNGIRLLVCGGRDFDDSRFVFEVLDRAASRRPIDVLIQGGAKGADRIAAQWAHARCVPYLTVPADWDQYGKAAGHIRNAKMLDMQPDSVVAFPGGRGTADMVRRAREAGLVVWEPRHG